MMTAKETPKDIPKKKVPIIIVFEQLDEVEKALKLQYVERPDDPSLIIQMQVVRSARTSLQKVFPYEPPSEE